MTQFFNTPGSATDREHMLALRMNFEYDQAQNVMETAEEIQTAARYLAARLREADEEGKRKYDPPNVTVVDPNRVRIVEKYPRRPAKLDDNGNPPASNKVAKKGTFMTPHPVGKFKVLRNVLRDRNEIGANFHHEEDPEVVGMGWLVSTVNNREGTRTVVLLENGELYMGGPAKIIDESDKSKTDDKKDKAVEVVLDENVGPNETFRDDGHIDLSEYPAHSQFTTVSGFAETVGVMPQAARDKRVQFGTEFSNVAVNLERIEHDMRIRGRELLGLQPTRP